MSRIGPLAVLVAALVSTACGGGADDAPSTAEGPAATPSTATRPHLSDDAAAQYTIERYLAQAGTLDAQGGGLSTDNWTPPAVDKVTSSTADFIVAGDGSGTHTTVQAAINAVPAASGSSKRHYILVKPGTYRELVCANGKAPITLYGASDDASQVVIVNGNYNGRAKQANVESANPCNPSLSSSTYGTSGSASVAIYSHDFHAKNVTFANDAMKDVVNGTGYPPGASGSGGAQAVALMTQADRLVFENVRVLGHQDSLYVKTANTSTVSRAYFRDCYVEGDVDFVFGRGTMVFDRCTFHYLSSRLPKDQTTAMLAPSTSPRNSYGMLIINSTLTSDAGAKANHIYLGRAWDEGVNATSNPYVAGTSPNGQLVIRNSRLGAHIRQVDPWAKSTSGREYSAEGNRFFEYLNTPTR